MTDPVFLVTGQIVAVQNSKGKHFLWNFEQQLKIQDLSLRQDSCIFFNILI